MEPTQTKGETLVSIGDSAGSTSLPLQATSQNSKKSDETKITITLPTSAYFLSGIRDFTLEMVRNMTGFTEQWAFRFQSIVDELVNNAIEHGSEEGDEVYIAFVHKKEEWLQIVIEDTGKGPSQMNAEQMATYLAEKKNVDFINYRDLRGRGLAQIVAAWTDDLHFEDLENGGLRVIARKYLNKQAENAGQPESTKKVLLSM